MSIGFLFWLLMVLWLIFSLWGGAGRRASAGGNLLLFALFFLVGWKVFGFPIQG